MKKDNRSDRNRDSQGKKKENMTERRKNFRVVDGMKSENAVRQENGVDGRPEERDVRSKEAEAADRLLEKMESKKKKSARRSAGSGGAGGSEKKIVIILAVVAVLLVVVVAVLFLTREKEEKSPEPEETESTANQGYITYNGEKYQYNSNLKTMLFMGIDKREAQLEAGSIAGYNGQSDCLILLVMNQEDKSIVLLEIPRDTMVIVQAYGMSGDALGTMKAQLALQFAYGNSDKESCRLVSDAVSNLLYGIKIHDYLALNMNGIAPIVDSVGGVELTIPSDYTWIDPAFVPGATLVLTGEQAKNYVQNRDTAVSGSNLDRMERQTQFIQALFAKVNASDDEGQQMLRQFWSSGEPYMTTDLTLKTLEKLTSYMVEPEIIKIPGEMVAGEEHDEYYTDENALKELVIGTFYNKID